MIYKMLEVFLLEFCIPGNIEMYRVTCTDRTREIRQVVPQIAVESAVSIAADIDRRFVVLEGHTSFLLDEGSLSLLQYVDGSSSLERQPLGQFTVFLHV